MIATAERSSGTTAKRPDHVVANLENVNKNYGSVRALCAVNFEVPAATNCLQRIGKSCWVSR
jgi:hypothetical protein